MPEDKKENLLPEEVEANHILAQYDKEIEQVQTQLDAVTAPSAKPVRKPEWIDRGFVTKPETELSLQNKIAVLQKQAKGRVAELAAKSRPAVQGKLYEQADTWRGKVQGQKDEKSLDESTSFVGRLRERGKFAELQKSFDQTEKSAGKDFAENKHDAAVKPSNYYSHLHFNDHDNPRLPDVDREVSVPEPDKED